MWNYEKRLQYPVNISQPNPKMAQFIMSQYGGPDGEMGASMRYLSQRYAMPYDIGKAVLTDIGMSVSVLPLPAVRRREPLSKLQPSPVSPHKTPPPCPVS